MSQKELHEQKMEAQLAEWKAELDKVKAGMRKADAEARLRLEKESEALSAKIESGKAKLSEIRKQSGDAFQELKDGAAEAFKHLGDASSKAADKFKN